MKRILITGGNGFLGSSLVKHFIQCGHEVAVVSRSSININNIKKNIIYIECNSNSYYPIKNKILLFKPDVVIHMAWSGGNNNINVNDISQFNNILLSISLLDIINILETKPIFIGVGSFEEYGQFNIQAKETNIENPINLYGLCKFTFKNISQIFCQQYFIPWTWIRPCYIYGPNDVDTRLIPRVILAALSNKKIILNSCNTIIDYLYIDDFCYAISKILDSNLLGIYNICSGEQFDLKKLLIFIYTSINSNINIEFNSNLDINTTSKYICGDNLKMIKSGWRPTVSIHQGLLNTINYYLIRLKA
jgi:UDP-glucose 4-epimerase